MGISSVKLKIEVPEWWGKTLLTERRNAVRQKYVLLFNDGNRTTQLYNFIIHFFLFVLSRVRPI